MYPYKKLLSNSKRRTEKIKYLMKTKFVPFVLSTTALCMLVAFPDVYLQASYEGIKLFVLNVLPALLPFFFFTKILLNMGVSKTISKTFNRPCKLLYNTSGKGGFVFVMSILSGYPVGAKTLSDLYKNNELTSNEVKTISAFTSTSGPMFVLGTVGAVMLNNTTHGFIILICHYLSAIINGLFYRKKRSSNEEKSLVINTPLKGDVLSNSVQDTIYSLSICGAYIAIFYMIAIMLKNIGILDLFSNILNLLFQNKTLTDGIVFGLVEITGGCKIISSTKSFFALPSICAIISFGGLSVTLQSLTFLGESGLSPLNYVLRKITQSIIAFALTCLAVVFFCP